MYVPSIRRLIVLATLTSGCAGTPGPSGYLQPAEVAQYQAYGAWIKVYLKPNYDELEGEFIAIDPDTLFVLNRGGLHAIPRDTIERARLGTYNSQWGALAAWTTVGSLATMSHGWYAGITLPVWMILGSVTTAVVSHGPIEGVRGHDSARWRELSKFARFPQGMPTGIDRTILTMHR